MQIMKCAERDRAAIIAQGTDSLPFRKFVAVFLVMQCTFALAAQAQAPAAQAQAPAAPAQAPAQVPAPAAPQSPAAPAPTTESLKILVLEGQHSINNTTRHVGIEPVVEVRDQNDRPVEGATVVFRLPPSGPGGTFAGQSLTSSTRSNGQGQAAASGFIPNDQTGSFDIHVTASLQNQIGEATISQTNSSNNLSRAAPTTHKPLWRNKWVLIGAGATVAAVAVIILTHSSSSTAVTITPGAAAISQ